MALINFARRLVGALVFWILGLGRHPFAADFRSAAHWWPRWTVNKLFWFGITSQAWHQRDMANMAWFALVDLLFRQGREGLPEIYNMPFHRRLSRMFPVLPGCPLRFVVEYDRGSDGSSQYDLYVIEDNRGHRFAIPSPLVNEQAVQRLIEELHPVRRPRRKLKQGVIPNAQAYGDSHCDLMFALGLSEHRDVFRTWMPSG